MDRSPQWQIEGLRRLEIPDEMQKQYGFAPLGAAEGPVKSAIFGLTSAKLFDWKPQAADRFDERKAAYLAAGPELSNLRYGYLRRAEA